MVHKHAPLGFLFSKGPNLVSRAHWPTKENLQICDILWIFLAHGQKRVEMLRNGARMIFPTNPDLVGILGRMDFEFENFYIFYLFGPHISGFPGPQISKFPDFQVPRFPDAAAACGRTLRSQPDPSPNAPRDQIRRKELSALAANMFPAPC